MVDESRLLEKFAQTTRDELVRRDVEHDTISFTPLALVAFWGRLLASLHSRRSRRKMSEEETRVREEIARKLREAAATLSSAKRRSLDEALATRPMGEVNWMREALSLSS
jgi:hypothetical protein